MLLCEPHWKRRAAVGILAVVMISTPCRALSQQLLERPATDTQRRIIEEIREIETRDGPNSAELIEPLAALGMLHHESGDPVLAAVASQRALEVVRITYGLHSLEQAPLIRQLIASQEALGQSSAAWNLEQDLLALAERHPDDLRIVPIFRATADRRMATLEEYLAGEFPPQIVLGCYYGWPRTSFQRMGEPAEGMTHCSAGSRSHAVQALTVDAQKYYARAIAVIHQNEQYSSDVLRELEMELIRCSQFLRDYDEAHSMQLSVMNDVDALRLKLAPWRDWKEAMTRLADWNSLSIGEPKEDDGPWHPEQYRIARDSLERLFAYAVMTSAPWQQQADTLLQIADWDLLHSKNKSALRGYEHVYNKLAQAGIEREVTDQFFQPSIPIVLPAFRPNPLRTKQTSQTNGHIDVAFEITRYGLSRHVEIIDNTANVSSADIEDLVSLIKRSRFRPGLTAEGPARRSHVVVRYHASG